MTIISQPSQDSSLYVVVGHDEGVEFRQVLLQVLAEPTENCVITVQITIRYTIVVF